MPFLRVIRDRRGYETTYLMDWYRDAGRQRSRVLYAFHGPTGARVGREAIPPETARTIETQYAHVTFDWRSIVAERQIIESAPEVRRRRPREPEPEVVADGSANEPDVEAAAETAADAPVERGPGPQPPRVVFPAAIEGETTEERVAFLARWYPVIRERVSLRASDVDRQQALLALAERLNPEAWPDADAVSAGLPAAAEALQRLSLVFARRRRTRRRSPGSSGPSSSEPSSPPR